MEEGFRGRGGLDSMMFEWTARQGMKQRILNVGVDPAYHFELGTRDELHEMVGVGFEIATQRILEFMKREVA
jgi:transketolase